jgi:hypothetical protein
MRRASTLILTVVLLTACDSGQPATDNQPRTADFGHYGPYRLGMAADEIREIAQGELTEPPAIEGMAGAPGPCQSFVDSDATAHPADRLALLLLRDAGYRVVGINIPLHSRTTTDISYGSDPADITTAYQGRKIEETTSQAGAEILVKGDEPDSYLGFSISTDGNSVLEIRVGTRDFAANYELCSGG